MALKNWIREDSGFSEGEAWTFFRSKNNKTMWVGKRNGKFVTSIDGEKLKTFKTNSANLKFARNYRKTH